jgi:hypothetical protein
MLCQHDLAYAGFASICCCCLFCVQALEWEDQYSSATPPSNEHPMPMPRSSSKGNLAEGMGGRRNSTGNLAENGVPEMGEYCT